MSPAEPIIIFEHQKLELSENGKLLKALQRYHGSDGTPYFSLIHNGVKFNQYVGVIQIGRRQIEVLPKVDKLDNKKVDWRDVLIQMLRMTSGIEAEATSESQLRVHYNSIFDLYIELFIKECEKLTHRGLIKRYQQRRANKRALKGRLHIPGQIRHNLIHKERFYVDYSSYEHDNLVNQILKKTLIVLSRLSAASSFVSRIKNQLLYFEGVSDFIPTQLAFDVVIYGRKNSHYKKAMDIAKLILLNYHPDISRGQHNVLALMFDMNKLWEKYIGMQTKRQLRDKYDIRTQTSKVFWKSSDGNKKRLKPDIVLRDKETDNVFAIIDTKWKIPSDLKPSNNDLKQMFAYNRLFESQESILLYPGIRSSVMGEYQTENGGSCSLATLQILNNNRSLKQNINLKFLANSGTVN